MATEIELKFLIINDNVIDKITRLLDDANYHYQFSQQKLSNTYFDTAKLALRQLDMGLRVRNNGNSVEQTIKTAGQVIAGLHQRPEYNVEISGELPTLSLFPADIWPEQVDLEQLQGQLVALFSTNFERCRWLIENKNGSKIELVFDLGNISAGKFNDAICEIELELVSGKTHDLFALAKLLAMHVSLRPGIKSKAARGYELYNQSQGNPAKTVKIKALELIPLNYKYTIKQSFTAGLQFSLNQLQQIIDLYCAQPSLILLAKISEILALIRHGFWLFQDYLPENSLAIRAEISKLIKELSWVENAIYFQELVDKTGNYRKKIAYSEQLLNQLNNEIKHFPEVESVTKLFYSTRFNLVQLALIELQLLMNEEVKHEQTNDSDDLLHFSQQKLDASLKLLTTSLMQDSKMTLAEYLAQQKLLIRSLLTGSWCGSLYNKSDRLEFRNPWLDVKQGLDELHTLLIFQQHLSTISGEQYEKLHRWLEAKIDSLLLALDCSRSNAMTIAPYWR
jgi:triphosphatase